MIGHKGALIGGGLLALMACRLPAAGTPPVVAGTRSGIEMQYIDSSVRPQDDFYQYVNGKWLDATDIPADLPAYGTGPKLFDDSQAQLRAVIEDAARDADAAPGGEESKIADLYNSFLDEPRLEELGTGPLAGEF